MNEYVDIEGLKIIVNTLNERVKEIEKIYDKRLLPTLQLSKEYLSADKMVIGEEMAEYEELYKKIVEKLTSLSDVLNDCIIKEYRSLKDNVNDIFKKNLNNEIFDAVNIKKE